MVLNDRAVQSVKPGTILWDSSLKGFGVRGGKNGKTFIVLVASGRRKKLGKYPHLSLADARTKAKKALAEKALGKTVPTHEAYDDVKDEYLAECVGRIRPSTLKLYTRHLKLLGFKRKSIGDITGVDILNVLKSQTPSNREHTFRIARTFFTWAYKRHYVEVSPMDRLETPPQGKARKRTLNDDELKKVYGCSCKLQNGFSRLVWLLIRTGQRGGETRALKRQMVAPDRITFPEEITKNGREHIFPISEKTYKTLMSFPTETDYLFPPAREHVRGKPVEIMSSSTSMLREFQKECGVTGWTLHDLRRTFATNMQKLGVPLVVTEAFLNHVSGSRGGIVGVYQTHLYFDEMKDALAKWERKLDTVLALS